jgi:hypothetical protein
MFFRNLSNNLGETGCQGGQVSPMAVAPNEEELTLQTSTAEGKVCTLEKV